MIIGLDIGTSVTKAVAFAADGTALAVETVPTRVLHHDGGRVEQDLDEIFQSVLDVLGRVAEGAGEPPEALGITGQGDGVWLTDERGRPAGPGISWLDGRATGVVARWMQDGTFHSLFERTGNAPFPGAAAPVLTVLDAEAPELLDAAATAAHCKDAVMQRLTGIRATDASDASNVFTDTAARRRDPELLARCGLSHRADLLSEVVADALPQGVLDPAVAASAGLPAELPVTCGPYDLPASAEGAGMWEPGTGMLIVGTTLVCQVMVDDVAYSGEPAGQLLCTRFPDRWLRAMPAMTGTAALDWALRFLGEDHASVGRHLATSPPGARGLRALPFLAPGGERAPFVAPDIRGHLEGLELRHTAADLVRAFCEALAFAARHCFSAAGLTGEIIVCGGGTGSGAWMQLFADAIQRPLRVIGGEQVGARGAAHAAAGQLGLDVESAMTAPQATLVEPDPVKTDLYDRAFDQYIATVTRAREIDGSVR